MTTRSDILEAFPDYPVSTTEIAKITYPDTPAYRMQIVRAKVILKLNMLERDEVIRRVGKTKTGAIIWELIPKENK